MKGTALSKLPAKDGELSILNVGDGDTKLSFDKANPAERIRAARIVADMLKRGYALLVEHPAGSGQYTRAESFDPDVCEYVIADFDPITAAEHDAQEDQDGQQQGGTREGTAPAAGAAAPARRARRVPADKARTVAVAPISGG